MFREFGPTYLQNVDDHSGSGSASGTDTESLSQGKEYRVDLGDCAVYYDVATGVMNHEYRSGGVLTKDLARRVVVTSLEMVRQLKAEGMSLRGFIVDFGGIKNGLSFIEILTTAVNGSIPFLDLIGAVKADGGYVVLVKAPLELMLGAAEKSIFNMIFGRASSREEALLKIEEYHSPGTQPGPDLSKFR
jgi:hypothetical protein